MEYGVLSILPAMIVIIFALLTKKTLEALLLGTLSTYIIMYGFGFGSKWSEAFLTMVQEFMQEVHAMRENIRISEEIPESMIIKGSVCL